MEYHQTGLLLTEASAVDGRTYDGPTRLRWHELIGHLSVDVARAAILAVQSNVEVRWMEPRHVLDAAKPIQGLIERGERVAQQQLPKPPHEDPLTPEFKAELERITEEARREAQEAREARRLGIDREHVEDFHDRIAP